MERINEIASAVALGLIVLALVVGFGNLLQALLGPML